MVREKTSNLDIEKCIEAETFFEQACSWLEVRPVPTMSEMLEKMDFFRHVEHEYKVCVKDDPGEQIADHLHFSCFARDKSRRILTKEEFDMEFDNYPSLFPDSRDRVWRHMIRCPIFFINTHREVLDLVEYVKRTENKPGEILKYATIILRRIRILEEYRHNFQFCYGCEHDAKVQCTFWQDIARAAWEFMDGSNPEFSARRVRRYFQLLELTCKIPPSFEDFKKDRENQPH